MTARLRYPDFLKTRPAAMPMRMAVSAVMGSLFARPRTPSVPKRERDIEGNLLHCRPNSESLTGRHDVVDPHDGSAPPHRLDRQPSRCRIAIGGLVHSRQLADEAFARAADQDG